MAMILSLQHQQLHPTRNQLVADPECDLNYVPNVAIKKKIKIAISNSFGFGGHNVCLVAKRYE
jgi:3-oxoacyl-[acyl-carrier-protein] synthase II